MNRGNFNRILKAIMEKLRAPEAHRFISHGFRRGTSQDLKESGSPWASAAPDGACNSPAFRRYLDMSRDVEIGVMRLCDVDMESDSDAEQVPLWVYGGCSPLAGLSQPLLPWVLGLSRAVPVDVIQLSGYHPHKIIPLEMS